MIAAARLRTAPVRKGNEEAIIQEHAGGLEPGTRLSLCALREAGFRCIWCVTS
jgi:hypothetical protein